MVLYPEKSARLFQGDDGTGSHTNTGYDNPDANMDIVNAAEHYGPSYDNPLFEPMSQLLRWSFVSPFFFQPQYKLVLRGIRKKEIITEE